MTTLSQKSTKKNYRENAAKIAQSGEFQPELIKTKLFNFTTYQKNINFEQNLDSDVSVKSKIFFHRPLVIYIEGDGHAWASRNKLSKDPTPRNPLALKLALLDSSKNANIVYLARPCQYTPRALDKNCHPEIWSTLRFSEAVIDSMNEAVDKLKEKYQPSEIQLIGYSGGAAVAVLIAARRKDITSLTTIAGDLDHQMMSEVHQTTPLEGSLNPRDFAAKVAGIPQYHYIGAEDKIVPPFIVESFVKAVVKTHPSQVHFKVLPAVGHHRGWEEVWASQALNN